jgi:hypothetical protein
MSVTKEKRYPDGYPSDALKVIQTMSFTNGETTQIVGSMSLRSQLYAGDYDAYEVANINGSREGVVRQLVKRFKQIIHDLNHLPNTYIGDIKSGTIQEWTIIDHAYNYEKSMSKLEKLRSEHIIDSEMYEDGKKRIKPRPSKFELLALRKDFRPNIVRWKPREILAGFKILKDGRKYTLEEAIQSPTITKIDVVSWVQNNRFTDFSMIYEFQANHKTLNIEKSDIDKSIRENIFMLFHEHNYFKMAKRMFSFSKYKGYQSILQKLSPMFNGDLGRLYMVYGDIGTIESVLESEESIPYEKLELEIDQFKGRLSNIVLEKFLAKEPAILEYIDELVTIRKTRYSREHMKQVLGKIKEILSDIMNESAKRLLTKLNLMPTY